MSGGCIDQVTAKFPTFRRVEKLKVIEKRLHQIGVVTEVYLNYCVKLAVTLTSWWESSA